jgi:hypothetical protein
MILKQILGLFNNVFQLNKLYRIEWLDDREWWTEKDLKRNCGLFLRL